MASLPKNNHQNQASVADATGSLSKAASLCHLSSQEEGLLHTTVLVAQVELRKKAMTAISKVSDATKPYGASTTRRFTSRLNSMT